MKVTAPLHTVHFGELAYIRGLVTYRLSPFEQKAYGPFFKSILRTAMRIRSSIFKVVPPFAAAYLLRTETEKKFDRMCRKNPKDYVDDK
uniref:Cytochrome b-c1 complex subunit 8 n=1 Tax=Panstrongylus lignarius TaxID=156445 RepID=A0A224XRX2_9HEMI